MRVERVCKMIGRVANAGSEYEALVKGNVVLVSALGSRLQDLEGMGSAGSTGDAGGVGGAFASAAHRVQHTLSLCAVGALPQLLALERACTNVGNKPSVLADILLEAYNTLCEQDDQTLQLQVQASRGPLTTAAVQVLQTYNEGKKGKGVFLEACMLLQLLLKPWGETEAHTTTKREIAHTLQEAGIVPAVMRQMVFWAEDWQGMYGDCGRPCFKILLELLRHIPETRTAVGESVRQFVAQASLHQSTGTGAAIEGYEYETPTSTLHRINQLLQN
mmetsp:Transcript_26663/g.59026  ORF Transcript_26663/g.59026 Transcript_26663/m.59026 type:complete len:275 (+) Transcript_26663:482-1306(+)